MTIIDDLRDGLAYVAAELRAIHEDADGDLDEDTQARWDEGEAYVTETRAAIEKHEARAKVLDAASVPGAVRNGDGARDFQHQRRVEDRDVPVHALSRSETRDKALALVERAAKDTGLSGSQERAAESLIRRPDGVIAQRALITESPAYRSAFMKLADNNHAFNAEEVRALEEAREMNIVTAGDGGYGVPILIDPTIILTDQETENPFIAAGANVEMLTTKDWRGVSAGGVTWAFETESAVANDISPTLAQPTIYAHKAQGAIPYSIEVEQDYPGFASEMGRLLSIGYDELLVSKFTTGSGSGEPWGIFEACEQATSQVTTDTDGEFNVEDVLDVWGAVPQKYRRRAAWLMNVLVNNEIRLFGDDKLSRQTVNLTAAAADTLMGRPVYESPYAPSVTATTGAASILVVGDFSQYYIAQRAGMNVEFVPHLLDTAASGLPKGQRALYAWTRVGADAVVDNAFRMLVQT